MARRFRVSLTRHVDDSMNKTNSADVVKKLTRRKRSKRTTSTSDAEVCASTVKAMEEFMATDSHVVPEMWCSG